MKPKDRVYCPYCHRSKMLFASRKEAEMFMQYNGDDIVDEHGYKPIRAYYCSGCCGWHITSKEKLAFDYEPVQKLLIKFAEHNTVWPDENDEPENPCIVKARKKVYTYIKDIQIIEDKTPESIEADMLSALAAIKGYLKLVKNDDSPYTHDANACRSYLCTLLVQTIIINLSKLSEIEEYDDVRTEELNRAIIKQTLKFTAILHSFDGYSSLSHSYKSDVAKQSARIHKLYMDYTKDDKRERIIGKLDRYINTIQASIDNNDYSTAGKFVHFAVVLIKKHSEEADLQDLFPPYIDTLMELHKLLPESSEEPEMLGELK